MKKQVLAVFISAAILMVPFSEAHADSGRLVTQIDVVTQQGNGFSAPQQIAVERTRTAGAKTPERIRMAQLPTTHPWGLAQVVGSGNVYLADHANGSIYEMEPYTGQVVRHFSPSVKPSNNIEGIATGLGEDLYVYYNGAGKIQRLHKDGTVVDTFDAPTPYGHSLVYKDNDLYLLDDRGTVYEMDAYAKTVVKKFSLQTPNGGTFGPNQTFALAWDGKYFTVANAADGWKVYRYNSDWSFHDEVDLQQWSMEGCLYDGKEYLVLNVDDNRLFTIRETDDTSGEVDVKDSQHYQYEGNVLTMNDAQNAYPQYPDRNIELLYNDQENSITSDFLKPLVSYLDKNGKRVDSMFDSFLFLPSRQGGDKMFYKQTDPAAWSAYLQKTMQDISVLNQEWAAKNQDLGQANRANVWIAVPYPNPADDLSTREQAVHHYIDQALSDLNAGQLANINFRGFYWYAEDSDYADSLVVDFNRYVHGKNEQTLWIPYQVAQEVSDYRVLGFDEVFQQPNYYFQDEQTPNLNRFFNLDWTGVRYGKGVEMELDDRVVTGDPSYRQLFMDYLHEGLMEGFLGASKAWYDDRAIALLYQQHDLLYDTIHQAVQGTYTESDVTLTSRTEGNLSASQTFSIPENAKIRLDILADQPYQLQKVILHTNDTGGAPLSFTGTLRQDEELVAQNGMLVKQEIGQATGGLRIGFNDSLSNPVTVVVVPQGMTIFADIAGSDPAAAAISTLSTQGILNGYMQNGQLIFAPKGTITRAQFATMLMNAYHVQAKQPVTFGDAKNSWYSNAVAAVTVNGLMSGYDADHFGPNDPITQEEVAAILVRVLHKSNIQGSATGVTIPNLSLVDAWAQASVLEGKSLGLYGDQFGASDFSPKTPANRADVATVLYKALNAKQS